MRLWMKHTFLISASSSALTTPSEIFLRSSPCVPVKCARNSDSHRVIWSTGTGSRRPLTPAKMIGTWISVGRGSYWPCSVYRRTLVSHNIFGKAERRWDALKSSVRRAPRERRKRVEASRSDPNWAKAATSRYWAR